MATRLQQLRRQMKQRSLDALLVTHLPHVRYLAGFSGSSGVLVITPKRATLVTDFRYRDQAGTELGDGFDAVIVPKQPFAAMIAEGLITKGMTVGFDESHVSVAQLDDIRKALKGAKLEKTGTMLDELVMRKTDEEIGHIRKAANIAAKVYREILEWVEPGMRESDVAAEISYRGRRLGSEGDAFDIIVASGVRGALPHGRASQKRLRRGELVTLDFGCIWNGFNSDMTRTFALGEPGEEARRIYDIVLRAEQAGVKRAKAGMTNVELDLVCRDIIAEAGHAEDFGHGTGHGLGISVHEPPYVSGRGPEVRLEPGMVVTIEPGIYLPGRLGVRIEDDVVITEKGARVLTSSPRELIVVER